MMKIGHIESFAYSTAKEAVVGRARAQGKYAEAEPLHKTSVYRTPKNGGLERAPECRLPGPKRTLHGYVAYYRS